MSDQPYNPDTLAEHLDKVLPPGSRQNNIMGEDDPLVQTAGHFASMPMPQLSAEAVARIKAKLPQPVPAAPVVRWRGVPTSFAAAAAVVLLVAIGILSINRDQPPTGETSTLIAMATTELETTIEVAETSIFTITDEPTKTSTATPTDTLMLSTATLEPVVIDSTLEPTPEDDVNIIIEGEIEEIREDIIIIHDMEISIDPDDPLNKELREGDYVRIEGALTSVGVNIVIATVDLEIVDDAVEVSEAGQVWRDEGDCKNPPPAWATANGWRKRCQPGYNEPPSNGNSGRGSDDKNQGKGNNK